MSLSTGETRTHEAQEAHMRTHAYTVERDGVIVATASSPAVAEALAERHDATFTNDPRA